MSYMQDFEDELRKKLSELFELEGSLEQHAERMQGFIRFVKEKLLESYKNGLKAGRAPRNGPSNFSPRRPPRRGRI